MANTQIPDAVRRIFTETFTARDVAEPLASCDAGASAADVRRWMDEQHFDVVGVRREGRIVGYVERLSLGEGECGAALRPLQDATVLDDVAPLVNVLTALTHSPFVLVNVLGSVGGMITPADIQKPAVRMWLFGIVTLIEMRFSELIERHCPGDSWQEHLSEGRMESPVAARGPTPPQYVGPVVRLPAIRRQGADHFPRRSHTRGDDLRFTRGSGKSRHRFGTASQPPGPCARPSHVGLGYDRQALPLDLPHS
jgi:hypothetical protein